MPTPDFFVFTQRHYDIIIRQAIDNLPQESGGFLGGKENQVLGILPTYNLHLGNRTDTFGVSSDDIRRAHAFFHKNGLTFFGLYHTHPKGIAYPSTEDIMTGQRYHFIVSLKDPHHPVFAAYEIIHRQPHPIPIHINDDSKYSVKDLRQPTETPLPSAPPIESSEDHLNTSLSKWRSEESITYPKMPPKSDASDFSTLA